MKAVLIYGADVKDRAKILMAEGKKYKTISDMLEREQGIRVDKSTIGSWRESFGLPRRKLKVKFKRKIPPTTETGLPLSSGLKAMIHTLDCLIMVKLGNDEFKKAKNILKARNILKEELR